MADENEQSKPLQPGDLPEAPQLPAAPLSGAPVPGAQLPTPSTLPAAPAAAVGPAVAATPDANYPSGKITSRPQKQAQKQAQKRFGTTFVVVILMVATAALILVIIGFAAVGGWDSGPSVAGGPVAITEPIPDSVLEAEQQERLVPPIIDDAPVNTAELNTAELNTAELNTAELNTAELDTAELEPMGFDTGVPVTFSVTGEANGSIWNVAVSEPLDITELVLDTYDDNDAPPDGVRFVGFDLEMTLASALFEPLTTGVIVDWELVGGVTGRSYNAGSIASAPTCGAVPNEFNRFAPALVGGTLSGLVCLPLPTEDASAAPIDVLLMVGDEHFVFSRNGWAPEPAEISESLGVTLATERGYDTAVPLELGDVFGEAAGSTWNVAVGEPTDVTGQVLNYNSYNDDPPPGFAFAAFDVELTLASADAVPVSAGSVLRWEVIGGETLRIYDIGTVAGVFGCGNIEGELDWRSELFVGGTVSGLVCIPVPIQDLGHPDTRVAISLSGTRTVFSAAGPTPAPAELESQGGPAALDDQHLYGEPVPAQWDDDDPASPVWVVTADQWADITDEAVAESLFNVPPLPGFVFVGFEAELMLERAETSPQAPGFRADWEVLGGETLRVYRPTTLGTFLGCGVIEGEFDRTAEVEVGESITGRVCIPVPRVDLENANTRIALDTPNGRVVFGPDGADADSAE